MLLWELYNLISHRIIRALPAPAREGVHLWLCRCIITFLIPWYHAIEADEGLFLAMIWKRGAFHLSFLVLPNRIPCISFGARPLIAIATHFRVTFVNKGMSNIGVALSVDKDGSSSYSDLITWQEIALISHIGAGTRGKQWICPLIDHPARTSVHVHMPLEDIFAKCI